jgi:hypothetical protein
MKHIGWTALCVAAGLALATAAMAEQAEGKKGSRFKAADTDGNGQLSLVEFQALCDKDNAAEKFKKADADGSGSLSREELRAAHHGQKGQGGNCPGKGKAEDKKT